MSTKLYHHKTDGGAEYLCTAPIEGTDEGDTFTTIVRLDGEPELYGELNQAARLIAAFHAEHIELLEALKAMMPENTGWYQSMDWDIYNNALKQGRAAISKIEGTG